ncbi:MAG TPA: conjugal transfer protein TraG N-terminal domain-containing protein [Planctomycetota bacterium]|nr:conjugal transfer protein TraG N-terminal domain-containing protein [Planctomycetota bacterium]
MEIQGLTPIDSLYEFAAYAVSLQIGKYLIWSGYLVGFVLSAALVRLYYAGAREGSYQDLAAYPLYVLVLFFLLWPIEVSLTAPAPGAADFLEEQGVFADPGVPGSGSGGPARPETLRVPRLLAYVSALVGSLQTNLVSDICDAMHSAMYQWKHIAAINANTRIFSRPLREDLAVYLKCCYYPALTQGADRESDPWKTVPFAGLPIDAALLGAYGQVNLLAEETRHFQGVTSTCADLHRALDSDLSAELRTEPYHQKALASYSRLSKEAGSGSASALGYARFYRQRLVYNQIFVIGSSSVAAVREALPDYQLFRPDGLLDMTYITSDPGGGWSDALLRSVTKLPRALAAMSSAVAEGWSQKALGPATYYRVSSLGPYVYGLLLAFVVMAFPIAGLLSFWPHWWTALVNLLKLFVSIKLWPIFWAYLSGMMSYRSAFTPDDPEGFQGTFGSEGMFPALALMYLVVPVFSFVVTSIAQHAGGAMLGSLLSPGRESTLGGTIGAATSSARTAVQLSHSARGGGDECKKD